MGMKSDKPEQDPAEGSRETVEHELARQGDKPGKSNPSKPAAEAGKKAD